MSYRYCDDEKIIDGFSYRKGMIGRPDEIVIRENEWSDPDGGRFRAPVKDIKSYIEHINQRGLEEAIVWVSNLSFLEKCPSLKRLDIAPPIGYKGEYDYSPLYKLPCIEALQCRAYYGELDEYVSKVDYSRISGLVSLSIQVTNGMKNFEKIPALKSLFVSDFKGKQRDLTDLFCSEQLDFLSMINCGIKSLKGIGISGKMERLMLSYCRSLEDISELSKVKSTLRHLSIESCGRIKDFSVLEELENLEALYLEGNNSIPDLKFLTKMKKLKVFTFSVNVENGDLSPCLEIPSVYCRKGRKHYNLKDRDLPKQPFEAGPTKIELWRSF